LDRSKRSRSESKLSNWLAQHKRAALQFSGGKDSLAVLHLLKPHWDRLIVLWGNPGGEFPETVEQMARVKAQVAEFHEVRGNSEKETAYPVDVLPVRCTPAGIAVEPDAKQPPLQSRFDCCFRNFWLPMSQKVKELGITLLIRGQRRQEFLRAPIVEGSRDPSGAEIVLPIDDWTTGDVFAYLHEENVELPPFYRYMKAGPKCMTCTAWLKDQKGKDVYLKKYHPEVHKEYQRRMRVVREQIQLENRYG
jgi:3'-phosphoadenosine 5'-phosphosulfate sulfotransferase (PAPS reductase)/FAD synthetase